MKKLKIVFCLLIIIFLTNICVEAQKKPYIKLPKSWAFIPSGTCRIEKDTFPVYAFYMCNTEVGNKEYAEFLDDLKRKGNTKELEIAKVDTTKWINKNSYNEPFATHYFQHKAYREYPVVNISYEGALLYCKWLQEKILKQIPIGITIEVCLPSRIEWIWAAKSGYEFGSYSWGGICFNNEKGFTCNFSRVGDEGITYNSETKKNEVAKCYNNFNKDFFTSPVNSYFKSEYGLYNMNGNVAEMVAEKGIALGGSYISPGYDVRNESQEKYTEPSPHIGFRPIIKFGFKN